MRPPSMRCIARFALASTPKRSIIPAKEPPLPSLDSMATKGVLINCTSLDQLHLLGSTVRGHHCSIRINPGQGHGESDKTNTGGPSSKHGIYRDQIDEAKSIARSYDLKITGVHSHIGSGSKPEEWRQWNKINETVLEIARGFGDDLEFVNLGGGLPVPYRPNEQPMDVQQWGWELSQSMQRLGESTSVETLDFSSSRGVSSLPNAARC